MSLDPVTEKAMVSLMPDLRAFALSLCRNQDRADDIVQETLTRAIARIDTFKKGTNLAAWLFTILRNTFSTDYQRSKRTEQDVNGGRAELLAVLPEQEGWCIAEDLTAALAQVPNPYRQALMLVGASGLDCHEAAAVAGCPPGTIKSRVHRGRRMLAAALSGATRVLQKPVSDRFPARASRYPASRRVPSAVHVSRGQPPSSRHAGAVEWSRPAQRTNWRTGRSSIHASRSRSSKSAEPGMPAPSTLAARSAHMLRRVENPDARR